jgi:hypothetical protein
MVCVVGQYTTIPWLTVKNRVDVFTRCTASFILPKLTMKNEVKIWLTLLFSKPDDSEASFGLE